MFCQECGLEVASGTQYCPRCGSPLPVDPGAASAASNGWGAMGADINKASTATQPAVIPAQPPVQRMENKPRSAVVPVVAALCAIALLGAGAVIVPRLMDKSSTGTSTQQEAAQSAPTKPENAISIMPEDPQMVNVKVSQVDVSSYPEVKVQMTIEDADGKALSSVDKAALSVSEKDGSGNAHAGAISNLADKGNGTFELTFTSGSGASAGESVTFDISYKEGNKYAGSTSSYYQLPEPEPEPQPQQQSQPVPQQAPQQTQAAPSQNSGYILPESNTRYYSASELSWMSSSELELARNEIYARHGRGFNTDYIQEYFYGCSWYTRLYSPEEFDAMLANNPSIFNDYEYANVDLLWNLE